MITKEELRKYLNNLYKGSCSIEGEDEFETNVILDEIFDENKLGGRLDRDGKIFFGGSVLHFEDEEISYLTWPDLEYIIKAYESGDLK